LHADLAAKLAFDEVLKPLANLAALFGQPSL